MLELIRPSKLCPGDKVAAISLSWGGAGTFPYRFDIGKQRLESIFGLHVVHTKHALKDADWIYRNPKARADDLMEAFSDPSIKGIISCIGGDDSMRLLTFVNLDVVKNNPKVFMGFSDTTITHFMCLKAGLTSFYGPAVMDDFAENIAMHNYTIAGINKTLFSNDVIGAMPQNTEGWTTELLDWAVPSNQSILRQLQPSTEWSFIGNCTNRCAGRLIGGCLEVLQFLNGTVLWPEITTWDQCILFLETSEDGIAPVFVARFLRNLAAQGILQKINGILFSKPGGHQVTAQIFPQYERALLQVFEEYALPHIPIVTRMDFGHSSPMWVLPYGALTAIDPLAKTVSILESGVV